MQKTKRVPIAATLLFSFLVAGSLLFAPRAANAGDVPIIVGKPIIKKDPPPPPKKDGMLAVTIVSGSQGQN